VTCVRVTSTSPEEYGYTCNSRHQLVVATSMRTLTYFSLALFLAISSIAIAAGPRILIVDAHPDDEVVYAATAYKIIHDLHGVVDLVVITNGEGGYKYSTLAEPVYGLKLTDEKIGRKNLPRIRHQELVNAGKIIGLHHIYFFDQRDNRYTLDPHEVLDSNWNIPKVKQKLNDLLVKGKYDFVFTLLPTDSTHGHHKAATILALAAINALPANIPHPVVLAGDSKKKGDAPRRCFGLPEFPLTRISDEMPADSFDRLQSFGFHHVLNYKIIVNWEIAEHKSQGTSQLGMNQGDIETFYYYDMNAPEDRTKAKELFDKLAVNMYPELTYPGVK
jgi:LmbE family N-acetylglucosaminyl deacetylase